MDQGDRIVVMNAVKVRQIGTLQYVYHESADTFVATVLCSLGMNLIEQDECLVGFRPEQFIPKGVAEVQDNVATFSFRVTRVEYLGADQLLSGELAGNSGAVVAKLSSESRYRIVTGETYDFVVQKGQLRFIDKTTGLRIEQPGNEQ